MMGKAIVSWIQEAWHDLYLQTEKDIVHQVMSNSNNVDLQNKF